MLRGILILFLIAPFFLSAQLNVTAKGTMPQEVPETSGLVFLNGKLYTHNDSGNTPQLFEVDTLNLEVSRTITIENAENVDWEDLASDDNYLYIGDFGNNNGDRRDLTIYRVSIGEVETSDLVMAGQISFTYEDQTSFESSPNSDWDAEALTVLGDELLVFTKEWQLMGSKVYAIPKTPGNYTVTSVASLSVNGLVTAATYNEATEVLYLLGYSQLLQPFLYKVENLNSIAGFSSGGEKINLNIGFAQAEGLTNVSENRYLFSSEEFFSSSPPLALAATLYGFNTTDFVEEENPGEGNPPPVEGDGGLSFYIPFGEKLLEYSLDTPEEIQARAIFDTSGRRVNYLVGNEIQGSSIDLSTLGSAVYYLTFYLPTKTISKPFFLD